MSSAPRKTDLANDRAGSLRTHVATPSVRAAVAKPNPHVRLTQEDILSTDLTQAGSVKKLLRKLHRSGPKRRAPGAACQRCHRLKRSCDGATPCSTCVMAGTTCIKSETGMSGSAGLVHRALPQNPELPISQGVFQCRSPKAHGTDPMRPSLGGLGMFFDLGWRAADTANMIGSCPPKLRSALDRLSCVIQHMIRRQEQYRKPLPEIDASMFESAQVTGSRFCRQSDGSTVACLNSRVCEVYGVHKEEFAARMGSHDMPLMHTEYRQLCWQLELLYQACFNESDSFSIFTPFCMNRFKAGGNLEEQWHVHRWNILLHGNGIQSTGVLITPEEFDRGVAQRSDALGVFAECSFSGSDLFRAKNLHQREKIAAIAAQEGGRRMLDELADKVVRYFRLDAEPAPSVTLS